MTSFNQDGVKQRGHESGEAKVLRAELLMINKFSRLWWI